MSDNVSLADLVAYLPANAKQLQARFPQLPPALIQQLITKGQDRGLVVWDSLSSRYKATGKGGAEAVVPLPDRRNVTRRPRECARCGQDFVPAGNRQKYCSEACGLDRPRSRGAKAEPAAKSGELTSKSGEHVPPIKLEVPSYPAKEPEQPPVSERETVFPVLHLQPRPPLNCHVEPQGADGPEFILSRPDAVVALDIGEAVAVMGWLRDGLQAWRERGAS